MLTAMTGVQAAGGTGFSLETLFEVARLEEKEARRIFPMDGLVTSVATYARTIYSSITDANGVYSGQSARRKILLPSQNGDTKAAPPPSEQWGGEG
jgi:hypothetical protein